MNQEHPTPLASPMTMLTAARDKTAVIRTRRSPACLLCGGGGEVLHPELVDRLFGAPGQWALKRCVRTACRLIWLDPLPIEEDLWKAYRSYYTHASSAADVIAEQTDSTSIFGKIRRSYLRARLGYNVQTPSGYRFLASLARFHPLGRTDLELAVMALPFPGRGGRLLDVGCGEGHELLLMKRRGWEVEGVDFDVAAVENARSKGLKVHAGRLEDQGYPAGSFDAIFVSHLIEHVLDPIALLRECRRLLAPRGTLVVITPNAGSRGHRRFGPDWRGLEPPRHLHLFNAGNIAVALRRSGFDRFEIRTFNRWMSAIVPISRMLRQFRLHEPLRTDVHRAFYEAGDRSQLAFGLVLHHVLRRLYLKVRPDAGEELLVRAYVA